jgi:hypothetical protein
MIKQTQVERKALELFRVVYPATTVSIGNSEGWFRLARKWLRMEKKLESSTTKDWSTLAGAMKRKALK